MALNQAVVIAEDDSDILEILSAILQGADFKVYSAADGIAAFDIVQKQKDVVLLITDIIMPEGEGLELIRKTRGFRGEIKIIAVSGGGIGDKSTYLELAKRLSADDCIEKPFDSKTVLETVQRVMARPSKVK